MHQDEVRRCSGIGTRPFPVRPVHDRYSEVGPVAELRCPAAASIYADDTQFYGSFSNDPKPMSFLLGGGGRGRAVQTGTADQRTDGPRTSRRTDGRADGRKNRRVPASFDGRTELWTDRPIHERTTDRCTD